MTAEVVVMNKEAVALAADSAVTAAGSKIFTTAEKLFMLAPGHPVGVMIFNNAHFMGLPWNVIIKLYRNKLMEGQHKFATLQEYIEDFISFLTMRGDAIFSEAQQAAFFSMTIDMILDEITRRFWQRVKQLYEAGEIIGDSEIAELVTEAIDHFYQEWSQFLDKYPPSEHAQFVECLLSKYSAIIETRRSVFFDQLPLTDANKERIQSLCLFLFTKDRLLSYVTGVAFAGYGADDLFPVCSVFYVENFVCGKLKYQRENDVKIDFNGPIATITPLAQRDIASMFLGGVHQIYLNHLRTHLEEHLQPDIIQDVLSKTANDAANEYTNPMMQSIAALPKGELAVIAETLVSITSFMRKHSMDIESVGGAIDIAVISKKDGFVWISRKHYFDIQYNQHFNQAGR